MSIIGINSDIHRRIEGKLANYGLAEQRQQVRDFLEDGDLSYDDRQEQALAIVESVLSHHGKGEIKRELLQLASVERLLQPLNYRHRDHVLHAVMTLLLGIYLNETLGLGVEPFQLKLATLLHDIAYPLQIGASFGQDFQEHYQDLRGESDPSPQEVCFSLRACGLDRLCDGQSGTRLMADRVRNWGLEVDACRISQDVREGDRMDHGVLGSLMLLKLVDALYKSHHTWDRSDFREDVVGVCASIFLHSLRINDFGATKLARNRHALPFLLRLTDELQDWDRPGGAKTSERSATEYAISIRAGALNFSVPPDRVNGLREAMACFDGIDILVSPLRRNNP
jgi:hypothetical protein